MTDLEGAGSWAQWARLHETKGELFDGVPEEFLTALGGQTDVIAAGLEQRMALYRSVLANRQVLIVLDDAANSQLPHPSIECQVGRVGGACWGSTVWRYRTAAMNGT